MKVVFVLVWLGNVIRIISSANIFVLVPTASFSHQQFYSVYLKELHKRGHNITVATPNPFRDPKMTNYKEIDLSYGYQYLSKRINEAIESNKNFTVPQQLLFLFTAVFMTKNICEMTLSDENLMAVYKNNEKFDVMVLEWGLYMCFHPFEKVSNGKVVGIGSFELGALSHMSLGNPSNPAFTPDPSTSFSDHMNFFERVKNVIFYVIASCLVRYIRWQETIIARKHFGNDIPSLYELNSQVALVLSNYHPSSSYPRAYGANFIPIGGPPFHLIGKKLQPLPKVSQIGIELSQ